MAAAKEKYIVLKIEELDALLSPEEKAGLITIIKSLNEKRVGQGKIADLVFPLSASDCYSMGAIETYIRTIQRDDSNHHAEGVKQALARATAFRERAIMEYTPTLP